MMFSLFWIQIAKAGSRSGPNARRLPVVGTRFDPFHIADQPQ
jgi:hypothetical protein